VLVLLLDVEPFCALVSRSGARSAAASPTVVAPISPLEGGEDLPSPADADASAYIGILAKFVVSALHAWGCDPDLDAMVRQQLGLGPLPGRVTLGFYGGKPQRQPLPLAFPLSLQVTPAC